MAKSKNRRLKISVTLEDIKNGSPCSIVACPIALAANRDLGLPIGLKALAYKNIIKVKRSNGVISLANIKIPTSYRYFIKDFDRETIQVEPFSFTVLVPNKLYK